MGLPAKKISLPLILLLSLCFATAAAQSVDERRPVYDRNNAIGIAIGIPPVRSYNRVANTAAFVLNYEHTTMNTIGPGVLSIGAEFAIYRASYENASGTAWYKTAFAARAIYHLTILKDKSERLDPYGGVAAGLYSSSMQDRSFDDSQRYTSDLFFAPFLGLKYNFNPGFGLWAEAGYDITIAKLGANFNF